MVTVVANDVVCVVAAGVLDVVVAVVIAVGAVVPAACVSSLPFLSPVDNAPSSRTT